MNGSVLSSTPAAFDRVPGLPEDGSGPGPRQRAQPGRRSPLSAVLVATSLLVVSAASPTGGDDVELAGALRRPCAD